VTDSQTDPCPDLLSRIPDPDTVRGWLADSICRCDLLRSLLRVAIRKAAYPRPVTREQEEVRREP
jgi:hypothetical protein